MLLAALRLTTLVALCAFTLAACDTAGGSPTDPPSDTPAEAPSVRLTQPLPDFGVSFLDDPATATAEQVDLSAYFDLVNPTGAPAVLSYEATAEGAVTAVLDGAILRVSAIASGPATVVVQARVGASAVVADTLAVAVRNLCPPGPGPGQADFLPLVAEETWRFQFNVSNRSGSTQTTEQGTTTLTLGAMTCEDGLWRRFEAREHREGSRTVSIPSVPGSGQTTPILADRVVSVTESSAGVSLPWGIFQPTPRYHPASPEAVAFTFNSSLAGMTLASGRGVRSYFLNSAPHVSYHNTSSMTRLDP